MSLTSGLLLGFSTGIFCFTYCLPIYLPILLYEKKNLKQSFWLFAKFTLGRFIAYMIFGAIVGYIGAKAGGGKFVQLTISLSMIFLAALMIFYSLGFTIPKTKFCGFFKKIKATFWLGFFTGLNVCPPFLLAIAQTFKLGDVSKGMIFFLMFFIGTSVYLVPLTFVGLLSKQDYLRKMAMVSGLIVGVVFLIYGLRGLSV